MEARFKEDGGGRRTSSKQKSHGNLSMFQHSDVIQPDRYFAPRARIIYYCSPRCMFYRSTPLHLARDRRCNSGEPVPSIRRCRPSQATCRHLICRVSFDLHSSVDSFPFHPFFVSVFQFPQRFGCFQRDENHLEGVFCTFQCGEFNVCGTNDRFYIILHNYLRA